MKTPRIVVVLGITAFAVAAGCGGGSSGVPTIDTFTASPGSFPSTGGSVTLVWSAHNFDRLTLDPGGVIVHGTTSATIAVTTTTDFKLTAVNTHGVAQRKASVVVGAPITVSGTLITQSPLHAAFGYSVFIGGQPDVIPAVSGSGGHFSLDGVVPPYDLVVVSPVAPVAVVYRGVLRDDPFVALGDGMGIPDGSNVVLGMSGSGTVTGATLPLFQTQGFVGIVDSPTASSAIFTPNPTTGAFSVGVNSANQETVHGTVHVLEMDSSGPAIAFPRAGSATLDFVGGNTPNISVPLSAAGQATATGAFDMPLGASYGPPQPTFRFSPPPAFSNPFGAGEFGFPFVAQTNDTYAFSIPTVPGTRSYATFSYTIPAGTAFLSAAITGGVRDVTLPVPPAPGLPVQNAQATPDTRFSCLGTPRMLNTFRILLGGATIWVVSAEQDPQFSIADLGLDATGLLPTTASGGNWSVVGYGMFDSMDAALDIAGAQDDVYQGLPGPTRSFIWTP